MSSYPPPINNLTVFNVGEFQFSSTDLTISIGDARYLKLTGGIESGLVTFNGGIQTASISNSGNTFTVPSSSGQLALVSQLPSSATFVDLTSTQIISGFKSFTGNADFTNGCTIRDLLTGSVGSSSSIAFATNLNVSPYSYTISCPNLGANVITTLPSTTGTLALVSQIPTNANFVDLTTNQTVAGIKTFSNTVILNDNSISAATYLGNGIQDANTTATDPVSSGTIGQLSFAYLASKAVSATSSTTYTSAATLQLAGPPTASTNVVMTAANAIQVDSGNVRLTNGRVLSTALGSAAAPAISIGTLLNEGIYSSVAGTLNFATAGSLRITVASALLTLSSGMSIVMSGATSVTSGTNGFSAAGPFSSSLTSSASTCSIRPTNNINTGLFGTAATLIGISVGGTAIVSCSTTGTALTGTLSASGVSTLTGGAKIGSIGSTTTSLVRGVVSYAVSLAASGYVALSAQNFAGSVTFASAPNAICSLQLAAGASFWDQCSVAVVLTSTTQITFAIKNNSTTNATSGTVNICYVAWI